MLSKQRLRAQEGMTLIELLVVILIIGILAAIALPAFLAQQAKAHDGDAKSNARSTVSAMEACYTEVDKYDPCPEPGFGIPVGTAAGEVEVIPAGDVYTIVAYSDTGNTFTVTKNLDSTVTRTCSDAGNPKGGCVGGIW
jgi:prepilin-type N-terminal cleavage/methylation domain-containing protein